MEQRPRQFDPAKPFFTRFRLRFLLPPFDRVVSTPQIDLKARVPLGPVVRFG